MTSFSWNYFQSGHGFNEAVTSRRRTLSNCFCCLGTLWGKPVPWHASDTHAWINLLHFSLTCIKNSCTWFFPSGYSDLYQQPPLWQGFFALLRLLRKFQYENLLWSDSDIRTQLTISNHFIIIPLAFFPLVAKKSPNFDCCHEFSG